MGLWRLLNSPEDIGRGLARALSDLSGKPADQLQVGLGRDMRLAAPELAGRYRDGLVAEGAHVVDAGMVGTEMLYWLVGSRGLDGGLMCTASHNPKAYTGAKIVERLEYWHGKTGKDVYKPSPLLKRLAEQGKGFADA